MLAKEWFDPEMPTKEFLLGVYEWMLDVETIMESVSRLVTLQDEANANDSEDCGFAKVIVYALVEHPDTRKPQRILGCTTRTKDLDLTNRWGDGPPTLADIQQWGKEMTADYFTPEATSD